MFDGIIAVDAKGKVELVNEAAARMLDLQGTRLIGRDVTEVVPNLRLRDVLDSGESQIGELQDAGSVRIITNRVPIKSGDEVVGAVATFQEVSRIVGGAPDAAGAGWTTVLRRDSALPISSAIRR